MIRFRPTLTAIAAALTLALTAPALQAEDHPEGIHIHDAYARASAQSGAIFFVIHNNTGEDLTLLGASSDVAEMTELHTHREDANGVMQMGKIEGGVALPAGEMHEFARGADHIMLMGLTAPLKDGDVVHVTLTFDKADPVSFDAVVDNSRMTAPEAPMGMMDHSQMQGAPSN